MKVLIVSYAFPPAGGVGVQRMSKLVKYLPEFGVEPTVLTAKDPSVPIEDETTLRDLPPNTTMIRTQTLEPNYRLKAKVWQGATKSSVFRQALTRVASRIFVPDPQILWLPSTAPALFRLSSAVHVVLISAPPFSPFLLGPISRVPFVLDYRDEWRMAASYEMHGGEWMNKIIDRLEPALARRASMIITATEEFRSKLLQKIPEMDPSRVVTITNGYDPEDFQGLEGVVPPLYRSEQRLVMTYAGTTFRHTSPKGLLAALRILQERDPSIIERILVRFVGRIVPTELPTFEENPLPCIERVPYVPRVQALRMLAESHVALLILDEVPHAEAMYPAKIFEIMHLRRPLLALAPQGAVSRLIQRHDLGLVVGPRDPSAIAEAIARHVQIFEKEGCIAPTTPRDIQRFQRRAIAERFADVLREAVLRGKPSPGTWRDSPEV